jgi:type 1 glutamine amidotransferase
MENLEFPKKPIALIVSNGFRNPDFYSRYLLNKLLFKQKQYRFSGVPTVEKFPDLLMDKIAVIILFFHSENISPDAINCLEQYVQEGGGLIAFLPALISFNTSSVYSEIMGARGMISEKVELLTICPSQNMNPIYDPRPDFIIRDKKPVFIMNPTNEVHFSIKTGDSYLPYIWTRTNGQGRVCGIAAGGSATSFQNSSLQGLISQSLNWCSKKVTAQVLVK